MLSFADMMYLLANELTGLRRRGLSFTRVLLRALDGFLLRHLCLPFVR
jgi:hypothetical protein